ncbi:MAG: tryptophan synthase subunit alpha [Euryarchaeota archaeon]|nr:tryptophan synthase subunit alpha [Euryarchaeota archaeon]
MNSIDETFESLREKNQQAFIPYITCGDPSLKKTVELIELLEKNGADIVEMGIPHSDPVADGPTIQNSDDKALKNGTTPKKALKTLKKAKKRCSIPIVLLTYYNIVLQYGIKEFVSDFSKVADGLIAADLPPEEASELVKRSKEHNFSNIFLASPITPEKRLEKIVKSTTGFLYVVSLLGITGERGTVSHEIHEFMKKMRPSTDIPMCVGFGISKPKHVREILRLGADGVIVGSSIVRRTQSLKKVKKYVKEMSIPTKNNP